MAIRAPDGANKVICQFFSPVQNILEENLFSNFLTPPILQGERVVTSKNNFSFIRMYTCTGVAEEVEKWGRKRELGLEMTRRREGTVDMQKISDA